MNRIRLAGTAAAAAAFTLAFAAAAAELVADPPVLVFDNQDMSVPVTLRADGVEVTRPTLENVSFLVDDSDYSHMINVMPTLNGLLVKPTEYLEVGSYDLIVQTSAGTAHIEVYSPLRQMPSGLDRQAEAMGITLDELKERLGMSIEREMVHLGLSPVYYAGEAFKLKMDPDPGLTYRWTVNGTTVAEGTGGHVFEYTFGSPGDYVISYTEEKDGVVTAAGIEVVTVVSRLAAHERVRVGTPIEIKAPPGYTVYQWKINDTPVEGKDTYVYTFEKPGRYNVEVIAEDPNAVDRRKVVTYTYVAEDDVAIRTDDVVIRTEE